MSGSAVGTLVLASFLIVAALATGVMLALALAGARSPLPQSAVASRGYAIRRWWFWIVLVTAVAAFAVSIPWFPYPTAGELASRRHFRIVAQQYSFVLPAVVPIRTPVVFDVTSHDVNHGFGIYAPDGSLVSQVQAMPDYVNHLPFEFTRPGHYTVRCLEYCGLAHAVMQAGFDVK